MAKEMFFIFWVFLLSTISYAGNNRLASKKHDVPFNVNEVIGRVPQHHNEPRLSNSKNSEFLIDTSIVYVPNPYYQMSPSIAFDGSNYLVVWEDDRNGVDIDIYGVRVNQAGFILDPNGIVISHAINDQQFPSVTFDGTNYLVVWDDDRSDEFCDIYGARINQAGVVLDPDGFVVSTDSFDQMFPCITSDGNNLFVVWQDMRNGNCDIYGARLTQTGNLIDTSGIAISVAADSQAFPAVSFDGTNYFVVWQDCRNGLSDIYGARVNSTGIVLDTGGIALSTATHEQGNPLVAFDGTNYLVVWDDYRVRTRGIYGTRVTTAGIILDTNGICISMAGMDRIRPSVNFDGTNYFVVWQDYRNHNWDIYGARVNQAGFVLDPDGIVIANVTNEQRYSSLAFDGTNYLVVWEDFRSGYQWDIFGARVSQTGSVIDTNGIVIPARINKQTFPSIAFDGTNYLIVWEDNCNDYYNPDIYYTRVDQFGVPVDPTSLPISTEIDRQRSPSVTYGGVNYFVVWEDWRNGSYIYGARINQAGLLLDTNGIVICQSEFGQFSPSVAFDGNNYMVVWGDDRGTSSDIYFARVNQDGIVIDSNGIALSTAPYVQAEPSIASDGANYFVAWRDRRRCGDTSDIFGARVNQAGIVLDPDGIAISPVSGEQKSPCVTFDGINYLVVWQDYRNGRTSDIYGARVNQAGVVLDPGIPISTALNYQMYPSVTFDGNNYVIVWEDNRSGSSYDIYGAKINRDGVVIDSFVVSVQLEDQISPAITKGPVNQLLITYSGFCDSINHHPVNTMRIWGKFYPFVGMEEERSTLDAKGFTPEIYPNPAKSELCVHVSPTFFLPQSASGGGEDRRREIKIFDVSGKLIKVLDKVTSTQEHKQEMKISLKGINPGIYFLRLGKETKKFIVTR